MAATTGKGKGPVAKMPKAKNSSGAKKTAGSKAVRTKK
jgi:hypothetical protein